MTMRTHTLITHLQPHEAYTLLELMDQVRDSLIQVYGEEMTAMLKEASSTKPIGKSSANPSRS